ncbi:hypothetical protein [Phenylobacterium montanum]|uniref:Uncharacterized protein n=1 Tax=Phenylobacterium montanum TaxID=2823693 RepID=A0A975IU55_9CAUL|nr:hypothetical protein [Caulobacter sp. S6]QUD87405.1 hypothetical protein KCG34_20490 [Caulobacter sp. S6]
MDYLDIDWQQERPTQATLNADWSKIVITDLGSADSRLSSITGALRETHVNGGAVVGRFSIESPPSWRWFVSRNRLEETRFFARFFRHPAVAEGLSGVGTPTAGTEGTLGFKMEANFASMGRLADTISLGGAYSSYKGRDGEVLRLASDFAQAAFQDRYSDICSYLSYEAWSLWFKGIAWDVSFFWFDARNGIATVLLVTDTD